MQLLSKRIERDTHKQGRQNPSWVLDHLANERTYLAWMGTAIALMGFGVVIVRLRPFQPPLVNHPGTGWKLGLLFCLVGLVTVLLSTKHYYAIRRDIDADTYEPAGPLVLLFSLALMLLGAGVLYFVFTVPFSPMSSLVPE